MNDNAVERFLSDADAEPVGLRPLREHASFILIFVLSAAFSALALTYAYSERYRAEMTIFFKPSNITRLSSHTTEALGSPFPTANLPFKVITQTITGLAGSDATLRRVVTDLHLDVPEPVDLSGPWYIRSYKRLKEAVSDYVRDAWKILKWGRVIKDDPVDRAVAELRRQIQLRSDDSYLFSVQVTAKTPKRAEAVANDLGAVLIELVHRDDDAASRAEVDRIGALRDAKLREIDTISDEMRDLLAKNQVASVADELSKTTERVSQLEKTGVDALAQLRQNEAALKELSQKLRDTSPGVAEDYNKLNSQKTAAEIDGEGYQARLDSINQSIAEAKQRLQLLNQLSASYDVLLVQLQSLKRDFAALTDAYQEAQIRATGGQSELKIQAAAEAAPTPVSPIKIYHVLAAGALGALVAVGLAYVFDYFNIRLFVLGERERAARPTRSEVRVGSV